MHVERHQPVLDGKTQSAPVKDSVPVRPVSGVGISSLQHWHIGRRWTISLRFDVGIGVDRADEAASDGIDPLR